MIHLNFNIRNPWDKSWSKTLWNKCYDTLHKNKFIELEVYKDTTLIALSLDWSIRRDHAGFDFEVGLFGYNFHFNLYDSRHWNDEEGRWMIYTEEEGLH